MINQSRYLKVVNDYNSPNVSEKVLLGSISLECKYHLEVWNGIGCFDIFTSCILCHDNRSVMGNIWKE